jgi:hypothetical protein
VAQRAFEELARRELAGALPPNLSIGGFLNTTKPAPPLPAPSPAPQSFLEYYLEVLEDVAEQIIRP